MVEIIIRRFNARDREAVRDIAWETAFMGESAEAFFQGKEILADFLTRYFTDYEPDSCFVAEAQGRVVGYLIGSRDSRELEKIFAKEILAGLTARFIFSGLLFMPKNLRSVWSFIRSFLKGEFKMEEIRKDYPATMHINLRKGFRGLGAGGRLIKAFEEHLSRSHSPGVHLATMSESAGDFFLKQGFVLLRRYPRSYFRRILGHDIFVSVYAKKIKAEPVNGS